MKKLGFLMLLVAVAAMLGGTALAQDSDDYHVTYFSGNVANAPDGTLRIINDGNTGGNLFASIYVFDDSEELTECCSCVVTPDGLLSESVKLNLTANPINGGIKSRGVIKVVTSSTQAVAPLYTNTFAYGLESWMTHIQGTKVTLSPGAMVIPTVAAPWFVTETELAKANLSGNEATYLSELCEFDTLLSGKPCTCNLEDYDY